MFFATCNDLFSELEVSRLLPAVLTQVQVVCELWRNSPSLLPAPPPTQHPISVCAIRNTRRKMEDRHVVQPNFNLLFGMEVWYFLSVSNQMCTNPYPAKLRNLNFHPLEVVSRYHDPHLQGAENN